MKAIAIAGSPRKGGNTEVFTGKGFTFAQINFWFQIMGFFVPGSTYWNVAIARNKGEVEEDEEGMRTAWNFGKNVALLLNKLKA